MRSLRSGGLAGGVAGIGIALLADVLLWSLVAADRSCSPVPRLTAGLIVAGCAGLIVAGFRARRGPGRGGSGVFLSAAGLAALLGTAPVTVAVLASLLCRP